MVSVASDKNRGITDKLPWIVSALGAFLLVVAFFLPYATGTDEYKERIAANIDGVSIESIGMTNADAADASMMEYTRVYMSAEMLGASEFYLIYVPLMAGLFVCALLALLFSVLRKPIPVMVFSVFTLGLSLLINWDFEDRGVVPSSLYDWGVAKWVYIAAAAIAIAGAVWLFVVKVKEKRALKAGGVR